MTEPSNQNQSPELETEEIDPLSGNELNCTKQLVERIRGTLGQLPPDRVGEVTALIATVEGHLAAEPPNAVAAREAFAMIRDELRAGHCSESTAFAKELDRVLHMLGAID